MLINLKLVPRSNPNDDGKWMLANVPPTFVYTKAINVTGDGLDEPHFCVMARRHSPQDGGPMHAEMLRQPEPQIVFKNSWYKE